MYETDVVRILCYDQCALMFLLRLPRDRILPTMRLFYILDSYRRQVPTPDFQRQVESREMHLDGVM